MSLTKALLDDLFRPDDLPALPEDHLAEAEDNQKTSINKLREDEVEAQPK